MTFDPRLQEKDERPYLEPSLDRWKVAVLAVSFFILLLGAMAWVG